MYVGPEIRGGRGRRPRRANKIRVGLWTSTNYSNFASLNSPLIFGPTHLRLWTLIKLGGGGEVLGEQAFLFTYSFSDMNILFCFMFPFLLQVCSKYMGGTGSAAVQSTWNGIKTCRMKGPDMAVVQCK
jgi:hypothetical protein